MGTKKRLFVIATLAIALTLSVSLPSLACSSGGGNAWFINHGNGTAWLIIHSLELVDSAAMTICVVAVNDFPGVATVGRAELVDPVTGASFGPLQFAPNKDTSQLLGRIGPVLGRGIDGLPEVTQWHGFLGVVHGAIPAGKKVDLMFSLRVDPSKSTAELARSLNAVGLLAMGSVTADGVPVEQHFTIQRPMEIGVMDDIQPPTFSSK